MEEVLHIAKNCRHYAMCKIDFLGTGVCASGTEKGFVSYFPQGRMDLYAALAENKIPVTEKVIDIADTCDLCGKCNFQCYFVAELKPVAVMKALKDYVDQYVKDGKIPEKEHVDPVLEEFRMIVGTPWATSDKGIAISYAHDPSPVTLPRLPRYVVMPGSVDEVSAVMKLISRQGFHYAVRGNGSSVMGFVMSEDVVLDMGRMKEITFDEANWKVRTGPGVSAFELQQEASKKGFRVNVAEPSALVCANIMCSGIFSTWSAAYGTLADNFINAEFVDPDGNYFTLNDKNAANLFAFEKKENPVQGICVAVEMKLYPITGDEQGILVPFEELTGALDFARECSVRRLGLAIGVLGGEYISAFIAPTKKLAAKARETFSEKLNIAYLVQIIGDQHSIRSIREMGLPFFDQELFRILMLGLPSLANAGWVDLFKDHFHDVAFGYLKLENFRDLAETALMPSPSLLAESTDQEVKQFFRELYEKPEMSDLVWLNTFRIISSRMGREKHVVAWILYLPNDNALVSEINNSFKAIADRHLLKNDFGFITPIHFGKRVIFEYDYFLDQNDPEEIAAMQAAMLETSCMIESYSDRNVKWIRYVLYQGMARSENFLYT